jgi:hypothetical protein
MKLTEIFEIADKREFTSTNADINFENVHKYIATAPAMEAKLRDMVDMLPNIKTGLSILAYSPDAMECERNGAKKTLEKLKQWGE